MKQKYSRRNLIQTGLAGTTAMAAGPLLAPLLSKAAGTQPNFLFIPVDDLNDWIGPLGGYPGVITPNFNRLAQMARVFHRAYTPAPACSPARSSVLFGVEPSRSGVYTNDHYFYKNSYLTSLKSLPKIMKDSGYLTYGTGKIFHHPFRWPAISHIDTEAWDHYEFCNAYTPQCKSEEFGDMSGPVDAAGNPVYSLKSAKDFVAQYGKPLAEGGPAFKFEEMPDYLRTRWMIDKVLKKQHDKPFFAALGLFKPHQPNYAPQEFFDLYPRENVRLPAGVLDLKNHLKNTNLDLKDLGPVALASIGTAVYNGLQKNGEWLDLIRSYLATITFTDKCLGLALDALLEGPNKNNTYIVLWSDHGYQLSEKLLYAKFSLWERATRVPMMIFGPGIQPGATGMPVSTVDLYPTIVDLAGRAIPSQCDGKSLKRHLLENKNVSSHAISTYYEGTAPIVSVRTENYRLIRQSPTEYELYDHRNDPFEWTNLMKNPSDTHQRVANNLISLLPKKFAAPHG